MDRRARIDAIEAVIHQDVGRNIAPLFVASRGALRRAVAALADLTGPLGLITGFYVPDGTPPAAETDGPVGVALLARALRSVGLACRVCTDAPCADACHAALAAAGPADVPVDVVPLAASVSDIVARWRADGVRLALAVERCGRTADGTARNMRGRDVGAWTALLDDLFLAGPWQTMAIGDGGNEIGMGALPRELIAAHLAHGDAIACVTPAAHLILAGVSHWGVYALLGGLAVMRPDWRRQLLDGLDPELDRRILAATIRHGPAVDGINGKQSMTIDNIGCATHHLVLRRIKALAEAAGEHAALPPAPSCQMIGH